MYNINWITFLNYKNIVDAYSIKSKDYYPPDLEYKMCHTLKRS